MRGALLVCGTCSDAGKSVVVAGICRWLAREGVRVAPFKAQNMALNSFVTRDGAEIGRAQATQAAAAGVEPEAAMNPILLKPSGERRTQVVVMGRVRGEAGARSYQRMKRELLPVVLEALQDLRSRFEVVICEGAGSPAEINLRAADLANMGLARAAGLPVLLVGDIDRGGLFASLYGTLALLSREDQAMIGGFLVNKFRGDAAVLAPGLDRIRALTGRPVLGTLPWVQDLWLDAEDSLALDAPRAGSSPGRDSLEVAVVRLRWISNFTDFDALAAEPGVNVRFTRSPAEVRRADLAILPGTKATVEDLELLRSGELDEALLRRSRAGLPTLGICGGYQMLGERIVDGVESGRGEVAGLGLLPVETRFEREKKLGRPAGCAPEFGGAEVAGYEIHHGRVSPRGGDPLFVAGDGSAEGCRVNSTLGTSWHGIFESDEFRRAFLSWVAGERGREWVPGNLSFAGLREERLDRLADLVAGNVDTGTLLHLIEYGPPEGLPFIPPGAPEGKEAACCSS
ncbi:cobyric acid synthase [Rubrobacter taiwanensis]|uniref:Cobyric acid synthase n=1 Tax=Rubrobacter taiwanensis TaxID=185139 RepID=A0A4R1B9P1_9ACTN|nr:cobyric acid synthase [Rubrobacter taiwanensis]TCJ13623.1 cobyric acid synthase [Rubrobacter taiwanensis]